MFEARPSATLSSCADVSVQGKLGRLGSSAVVQIKMRLHEDDPGCCHDDSQDRDDVNDPYVSHGGDLAYPRNLG